jgi:hypothetical protein
MSVASEFAPEVYIPRQARTHGSSALAFDPCALPVEPRRRHLHAVPAPVEDWSSVTTVPLRHVSPATSPLRLTRRGIAVVAGLVVTVGAALVLLAWQFGPSQPPAPALGSSHITVQAGDTLWSIASRVAPERDPRAEIAQIQRLNGLAGVNLVAGQTLRVR